MHYSHKHNSEKRMTLKPAYYEFLPTDIKQVVPASYSLTATYNWLNVHLALASWKKLYSDWGLAIPFYVMVGGINWYILRRLRWQRDCNNWFHSNTHITYRKSSIVTNIRRGINPSIKFFFWISDEIKMKLVCNVFISYNFLNF